MAEYCSDQFKFYDDSEDSFRFWQGLVGPYFTPVLSNDGTLYWNNTGMLPNPDPVSLRGPQGAGIQIAGIAETTEGLPETAKPGDLWLVGNESPYEGYSFISGSWVDLGELTVGPAGPPGPQGDNYVLTEADKAEIAETTEGLMLITLNSNPLPVSAGGTGANNLADAQENLGIADLQDKVGSSPLSTTAQNLSDAVNELADAVIPEVLPIERGGTGGDDLASAQENLGIADLQDIVGNGSLSGFTATDLTGAANELKTEAGSLEGIVGTGVLSGFAATDLTGAANELKAEVTTLEAMAANVVLQAAVRTVSGNGTTSNISLTGLTANHVVGSWGLFSDSGCTTPIAENAPTCDITITTKANAWDLTIANFTATFYIRPTFILKQN